MLPSVIEDESIYRRISSKWRLVGNALQRIEEGPPATLAMVMTSRGGAGGSVARCDAAPGAFSLAGYNATAATG
jgi:hypothetical protein